LEFIGKDTVPLTGSKKELPRPRAGSQMRQEQLRDWEARQVLPPL
jgi:hypothetical protein